MSVIKVNNITNRDGTSGPVIAGIATVSSTSHMVVPTGRTGQRYVDEGENIVRNGLVLYLDAKHSYPSRTGIGTTTSGAAATPGSSLDGEPYTWYDMSGYENHGELVNQIGYNSTNGGSLVFDGVNDYISIGNQNMVGSGNSPLSLELWMYNTKNWSSGDYTMSVRIKQDTEFFVTLYNASGTLNNYAVFRGYTQWGTPVTQSDYVNKWICLSYVYTGGDKNLATSYILYLNGVQLPTGTNNFGAAGGTSANCNIIGSDGNNGCNVTNSGMVKGNISSCKLYNRALTSEEVLQNFNAVRSRFGL
jgi:hypothetical protein